MRLRLFSSILIVLTYAVLQYWWLPPGGFFTGDSGAKYLQARAVVTHGPLHPWIDGPGLDVDTALQWQEPFLLPVHGHLVGVFSWLLSLLTAPFLAAFGLCGLYVIPALASAAIFLASSSIGRSLGEPFGGLASGWCAVLATPLLFYGAELWEHAPAVALSAAGTALLFRAAPAPRRDAATAGAAFVLAAALRPEALVVAPAILLARRMTGGGRGFAAPLGALAAGAALAAAAVAAMNLAIYGAIVPQQVTTNLQAGFSYWDVRREALAFLVLPREYPWVFAGGMALVAVGALARSARARLAWTHAAVIVMLGVGVGIPLWRTFVWELPWLSTAGATQLAHTWPALALVSYAAIRRNPAPNERAAAIAVALIVAMVFFTMPHTGGAQWSARFFLPAAPLAAALGAQLLWRRETRMVAVTAIALSIAVQCYGLTYLRLNKRINAQVTRLTASLTQPGDVVASDLFWYPQVTATLYPSRRLLFAGSPAELEAIAARAAAAGFGELWIATSTPKPDYPPFVHASTRDAGVSGLIFQKYVRP